MDSEDRRYSESLAVILVKEMWRVVEASTDRQYQSSQERREFLAHATHYVSAAFTQGARLAASDDCGIQALADAHFLLICWNHVRQALRYLAELPGLTRTAKLVEERSALLNQYKEVRDHFEHADERFPFMKKSDRVRFNLPDDNWRWENPRLDVQRVLRWGPHEWDVGRGSVLRLLQLYADLIDALVDDMSTGEGPEFHEPRPT